MKLSGLLAVLSLVCLTVGTAFTLEAPCEVTDSLRSLNSTDLVTIADFVGQPGNVARMTVHMTNVDSIAAYVLLITYDTLYLTPVRIFDTTWDHSGSIQSIDSTHILTEPLGRSIEVMAAGGRQPYSWLHWSRSG